MAGCHSLVLYRVPCIQRSLQPAVRKDIGCNESSMLSNADPSVALRRACHWGWCGTGPPADSRCCSLFSVIHLLGFSNLTAPGEPDLGSPKSSQGPAVFSGLEFSWTRPIAPWRDLPAVPEIIAAKFLNTAAYEGQNQRSVALPTCLPTGLEIYSLSA